MGRELKRVPLDFDHPVGTVWPGYVLHTHNYATQCPHCEGDGLTPQARLLEDMWYGRAPFCPEDRGSTPFVPDDACVRHFAQRNLDGNPDFYGRGELALKRESKRLCNLFNSRWCHHLNAADVAVLVAEGRLRELTHTWSRESGWQAKEPPHVPSPREVNEWSLCGIGHYSVNRWKVVCAEAKRLGIETQCPHCAGEGQIWVSDEAKAACESWEPTEPPVGDGYQIWETVSEGSPISPVFATPAELARHMSATRWGADKGTSFETWLAFIEGPGWAPTAMAGANGVQDGVSGMAGDLR